LRLESLDIGLMPLQPVLCKFNLHLNELPGQFGHPLYTGAMFVSGRLPERHGVGKKESNYGFPQPHGRVVQGSRGTFHSAVPTVLMRLRAIRSTSL
jgi:hypothetical protein